MEEEYRDINVSLLLSCLYVKSTPVLLTIQNGTQKPGEAGKKVQKLLFSLKQATYGLHATVSLEMRHV
jgi:hypothetical protein